MLPAPSNAAQWSAQAEQIRQRLIENTILHGWPQAWRTSPPKFEDLGVVPSGPGYRLRKLRYEIVPGFYTTALLYEPAQLSGKAPGVLDVMGHFGPGKASDFEQTLCINQALRGMIALNPEWLDMGELQSKENSHSFSAHLNLMGANGVGLFYLAMRKALDILYDNPQVDRERIGVTGLSGGGWQTIMLSSLDPRVKVAIPVAGYETLLSPRHRRRHGRHRRKRHGSSGGPGLLDADGHARSPPHLVDLQRRGQLLLSRASGEALCL